MELRTARNDNELEAMHKLREKVLYLDRGRTDYNRQHPADKTPDNYFLGFWDQADLLSVLRVDFEEDKKAVLRKVAVAEDKRNQGIGRQMIAAAENFIIDKGYTLAVVGSDPEAQGFYEKAGFEVGAWPRGPKDAITQPTVDMRKNLAART